MVSFNEHGGSWEEHAYACQNVVAVAGTFADPGVDNGQTRACMCEWVQGIIRLVNAKSLAKPVPTHIFLMFPFPIFDVNVDNFCTPVVELLSTCFIYLFTDRQIRLIEFA